MTIIQSVKDFFRRLLTEPIGELGRARRSLRYTVELFWHCALKLKHDRAQEMAAALTYRTIFSLVPMLVLGLLIFNAFGGFKSVGNEVQGKIYQYLGLTALSLPADNTTFWEHDESEAATQPVSGDKKELKAEVDQVMQGLIDQVSNMPLGSVGVVGLGLLIWAALALVVNVEQSFNRIFDCPVGRPWHVSIPIYWAVLTLGPALVFASLYLTLGIVQWVGDLGVLGYLITQATRFTALLASWFLLFLLFVLMPNTRVNPKAALIGSFVTAVLYESGKWGFGLYVSKLVPYSKLYGTLGLIPLFLFWVYVIWLIVLFGLELTYALQAMKGKQFKHLDVRNSNDLAGDPQWVVPILSGIGRAFVEGRIVSVPELAENSGLPTRAVTQLAEQLTNAGFIYTVVKDKEATSGLTLAMPPDRIALASILDLMRKMSRTTAAQMKSRVNQPGWRYLDELDQSAREHVGKATLATLLESSATNSKSAGG